MLEKPKILDCTLRDGGYYTNWDFKPEVIKNYLKAIESLPIEYIEIGYRNLKEIGYKGEFYYSPINTIDNIKKITSKKLVIILNERDLDIDQIKKLIKPCTGKIEMIRLATDPININQAKKKSIEISKMGFKVVLNVMYLSKWINETKIHQKLKNIEDYTDYLYLVDSYGSVYPKELKKIIRIIKKSSKVKIGFHGHNNLELAVANTMVAIEEGIEIVDSTIMGMGRGSGNLKTELLLSTLSKNYEINFDLLSKTLEDFQKLKTKYEWGTNLSYMIAGVHGIPQKKIMEWLNTKFYNLTNVVKVLNENLNKVEKESFFPFQFKKKVEKTMIIGGGHSVPSHLKAILNFLENNRDIVLIFSSARHLKHFDYLKNDKFLCLIGNENKRFEENQKESYYSNLKIVLPPKPREMGTYIPKGWRQKVMELKEISFNNNNLINHCSISLEIANQIGNTINYLIGFDGYDLNSFSEKHKSLFFENQKVFDSALENKMSLISLVPTRYSIKSICSIYSLIH